MTSGSNYSIRDEIREYWSMRAETFDLSPGHEIFSERERTEWHRLITRHLGPANGRRALDLACGTGVVSHLMDDLQFEVTGVDWSEAMLDRARAKSRDRGTDIRFLMRDAEATGEAAGTYDVIVTRHLVWTLVDPAAAFAHWHELLSPGGTLLIIDGDFVTRTWFGQLRKYFKRVWGKDDCGHHAGHTDRHRSILEQVHFRHGARAIEVATMLRAAGFDQISVDTDLAAIIRAQAKNMSLAQGIDRRIQHRYAICAGKR